MRVKTNIKPPSFKTTRRNRKPLYTSDPKKGYILVENIKVQAMKENLDK